MDDIIIIPPEKFEEIFQDLEREYKNNNDLKTFYGAIIERMNGDKVEHYLGNNEVYFIGYVLKAWLRGHNPWLKELALEKLKAMIAYFELKVYGF